MNIIKLYNCADYKTISIKNLNFEIADKSILPPFDQHYRPMITPTEGFGFPRTILSKKHPSLRSGCFEDKTGLGNPW